MNFHLEGTIPDTDVKICEQCGSKYNTATELCLDCTDKIKENQDSSAQIFLANNLPKQQHLTGIEIVGIRKEEFNWASRTFALHPIDTRIQRITDHINMMEKEVEQLRHKVAVNRQLRAEYENEFTAGLSKEDKLRWEKDAEKERSKQLKREQKETQDKEVTVTEKEIKKLMRRNFDESTAKWIVDKEKNGSKKEKLVAGMMKLNPNMKREDVERMVNL
jgi:hypothetical protein